MGFIFFGIILVVLGAAVVIKTGWVLRFFGPLPFAEKYLHSEGASILAYKLIGLILVFIGFLLIFDLFGDLARWIMPKAFVGE